MHAWSCLSSARKNHPSWLALAAIAIASLASAGEALAKEPAPAAASSQEYATRDLQGWTVRVSRRLLEEQADATDIALNLIDGQLRDIVRNVPADAVAHLREVPLWVSPEYPGAKPKAEFHPSADWLRDNGRNPDMASAVEFTNVAIFEQECRRMPVLVLHELAHAYHYRVLGADHPEVIAAYERAKASGGYDRVERRDARGTPSFDRAYAISNRFEYFAECSEAFFGVNDFFPFNHDELAAHDPAMCALLGKLWGTAADRE